MDGDIRAVICGGHEDLVTWVLDGLAFAVL
jgi:hypothetical protein